MNQSSSSLLEESYFYMKGAVFNAMFTHDKDGVGIEEVLSFISKQSALVLFLVIWLIIWVKRIFDFQEWKMKMKMKLLSKCWYLWYLIVEKIYYPIDRILDVYDFCDFSYLVYPSVSSFHPTDTINTGVTINDALSIFKLVNYLINYSIHRTIYHWFLLF